MTRLGSRNQQQALPQLRLYNDVPYPILSLYLGDWPTKSPSVNQLVSQARSVFKTRLKDYEQRVFRSDLNRMIDYLRHQFEPRRSRSVAFFSARDHLWLPLPLSFNSPSLATVSHSPFLQPLDQAAERSARYTVLLFDRQKAELMLIENGQLKRFDYFRNDTVPAPVKPKKEWLGRDDKVARQIEQKLRRHLRLIVDRLRAFVKTSSTNQIIIGGHQELFHELERIFKPGAAKIVAEVPVDFKKDLNQTIRKCLEAARR